MGMSIRRLLNNTPPLMKNGAKGVSLTDIRETKSKGGYPVVTCGASTPASRRKRVHETWFVGKAMDEKLSEQREVLAQCSCESYMYTFEVANSKHGAARILYSNGDDPVHTNPSFSPGLCKHLVKLAQVIFKRRL